MPTAIPYLSEARVNECLDPAALIDAMRQALIDLSAGKANQPLRMVMPFDAAMEPSAAGENRAADSPSEHGLLFLKPAQLGGAFATKLITLVQSNAVKNQPTLLATIVLMDPDTGAATAILEGATITAMRTAAVSAVAADALTPAGPKIVAMLGSGVLARSHARMLRLVRPINEIRVWSRSPDNAWACAQEIGGRACGPAEEAVRGADIICTVSNAATPILKGAWLKPGAFVAAVGAPRPTWRELDDDAMRNIVIADQRQAAEQESGDVILSKATITAEIGELLAGTVAMPKAGSTIIFKSLGQAVEDAVAAQLILHASLRK